MPNSFMPLVEVLGLKPYRVQQLLVEHAGLMLPVERVQALLRGVTPSVVEECAVIEVWCFIEDLASDAQVVAEGTLAKHEM